MKLPVLLYHRVGPFRPSACPSLSISSDQFAVQMRWLARHGYVGIRAADWLAWRRQGTPLPPKPVLLTFDDAYADIVQHALPVLRHYGFSAVVFVITKKIGGATDWDGAPLMTAEEIKDWHAQGIEFGGHSRTHPDLTTLTGPALEEEVIGCGKDLAQLLGVPATTFAYPYGWHNEIVRSCVRKAFNLAFSIEEGMNDSCTDRSLLRRTMIQPGDFLIDLTCRLRFGWSPMHRFRSHVRLRSRCAQVLRFLLRGQK